MVTKAIVKKGNKDYYTYTVTWSDEDKKYVGLCAEFPSLSWLADSQAKALLGIKKIVAEVIDDMTSNGEPIPAPLATSRYSGKFIVRLTPDMHRRLAIEAAQAKVSFNRLISSKLAKD